jgi:gliding motility-associated-like protein
LNNDGKINVLASSGTSPYQYSVDGTNFQLAGQFNNLQSGNYSASLKDARGCIATNSAVISVTNNLALVMNKDTTICEGGSAMLHPSSNGTVFTWIPSTGLNNPNKLTVTASAVTTTKYYLSATLGACSAIDSVMVFVNPAPVAFAGNDTTICYGQSAQLNGTGGINYSWSPSTYLTNNSQKNPVAVKPSVTTTYSLTVSDINHCQSILPSTVAIHVTPPAKVFAGNDTSIAIGQPLQLYALDVNNSGFVSYSWSPGFALSSSSISNPILIGEKEMTYTVTAVTQAGCEGSDDITIKVYQGPEIYVPTAFTPNGDGHNDRLRAIPVGIKEFKYFIVYNRWGQKVFYTTDASKGWDGTVSGMPQDTYSFVWIAEGIDYKGNLIQRKGTVTLIR